MAKFALDPEVLAYARALDAQALEARSELSLDHLVVELDALTGAAAGELMPAPAARLIEKATTRYGANVSGAYAKLLVLTLIEGYPSRVQRIALPDSIKEVYPRTLHRIAGGLAAISHESYIAEHGDFWRDVRLSSQLAVPLTASRVLDRIAFLPRTFFRDMGVVEDLRCLARIAFRLRGFGPIFRVHIDERDLSDFDEAGFERAYLRIAEMLGLYPAAKGAVGTSWTHDPQLDRISPKLTHPRRYQAAHGAFLRREGSSELTTQRALIKSRTRRSLYERGEYIPVSYTIVWPRRDMLRWAKSKRAS